MLRSPIRSGSSGGAGSAAHEKLLAWKTNPGVVELTTISVSNTWYNLVCDPDTADVDAILGFTNLGNGVFRNDSGRTITQKIYIAITAGLNGTATTNTFKLGYGKYNGSTYDFQAGKESGTFDVVSTTTTSSEDFVIIPAVAILANEQFRIMLNRTSGTRNLELSNLTISIA